MTAALRGARVKALDLSPVLLEKARSSADLAGAEIEFTEGDVEALPFKDGEFDVVVSQFGHMFAPRPEIAVREMLRVLRPGGRIAFSTWPPELYTGRMFALISRYMPPPPMALAPPPLWGDPKTIRERLGDKVSGLEFDREVMLSPALSVPHFRTFMESVGPLSKLGQLLKDDPARLKTMHAELEALIAEYFRDNTIRQHYLLTRATKL